MHNLIILMLFPAGDCCHSMHSQNRSPRRCTTAERSRWNPNRASGLLMSSLKVRRALTLLYRLFPALNALSLSLPVDCTPALTSILQQARELLQSHSDRPVHLIDNTDAPLHISLSRDLYLRSNQRDPLQRAARTLSTSQSSR